MRYNVDAWQIIWVPNRYLSQGLLINHEGYNEDKTSKPPLIYCFIPNVPNQKKADVKMTTETGVLFC